MRGKIGRRSLQAAWGERELRRAIQDAAFVRRVISAVLVGIDEAVALLGGEGAHLANGAVHRLAAVGRQLAELLKHLSRLLFLGGRQVFPGFHAAQHALLLLRRPVGKVLQAVLQLPLLLRRKPAELRITFESAALLLGDRFL